MRFDKITMANALRVELGLNCRVVNSGPGAVSLAENSAENPYEIILSYNKWPGVYDLGGRIVGSKSFNAVEDFLEKYYRKYNIGSPLTTISITSRYVKELTEDKRYHVGSVNDVKAVAPLVRTMVFEDLMPFFSRFQSLEQVYEHVEAMEVSKMGRFLLHPMPVRRMILKGLLRTPDFGSYSDLIVNHFNEKKEHPEWGRFAQFLPALLDDLRAIQ